MVSFGVWLSFEVWVSVQGYRLVRAYRLTGTAWSRQAKVFVWTCAGVRLSMAVIGLMRSKPRDFDAPGSRFHCFGFDWRVKPINSRSPKLQASWFPAQIPRSGATLATVTDSQTFRSQSRSAVRASTSLEVASFKTSRLKTNTRGHPS